MQKLKKKDKDDDNINYVIKYVLTWIVSILLINTISEDKLSLKYLVQIGVVGGFILCIIDNIVPDISESAKSSFYYSLCYAVLLG